MSKDVRDAVGKVFRNGRHYSAAVNAKIDSPD